MGLLRFILALSVVAAHSGAIFGSTFVGGQYAVESFYIISGFYMSLILNEKYINANGSYRLFITNRFMRLFPIYWIVLLLTVITSLLIYYVSKGQNAGAFAPYITNYPFMNMGSFVFMIFTNIVVFFQDAVMFLGLNTANGHLFFTSNFSQTNPQLYTFLFLPQAWTIAIELTFYLVAPFIVRRKPVIILTLLIISVFIRLILYRMGLHNDPWTYRFFPTELAFFLLGTIAYHIYKKIENKEVPPRYIDVLIILLLLFTFFFNRMHIPGIQYVYIACIFITLPFIFKRTKRSKMNTYIGELSYPMYISHIFILGLLTALNIPMPFGGGLTLAICTILFSLLLNELVAKRIEKLRQRRIA